MEPFSNLALEVQSLHGALRGCVAVRHHVASPGQGRWGNKQPRLKVLGVYLLPGVAEGYPDLRAWCHVFELWSSQVWYRPAFACQYLGAKYH